MKLDKEELKYMEHLFWLVKNAKWPEIQGDKVLALTEMLGKLYDEFKKCKDIPEIPEIKPTKVKKAKNVL